MTGLADPFCQVMMGPFEMGTTRNLRGIWQIAHRLHVLIEWGRKDYREWFRDTIVEWFQGKCFPL